MPVISNCNQCNSKIKIKAHRVSVNGNFCNRTCWKLYKQTLSVKLICLNCGGEFKRQKSRLKYGRGKHCSPACQYQSIKNAPRKSEDINCTCLGCGTLFSKNKSAFKKKGVGKYCNRSCRDLNRKGKLHPQYIDGGEEKRGANWQSQKRKALKRDNKECQVCFSKINIHVHHKIPYRKFNNDYLQANKLDNLVCLCEKHHREADALIQKNDRKYMNYTEALLIAERLLAELRPYCYRAEIAGSIRRKKSEVKDIEIVIIPKLYDTGLFESGIASVINKYEKVKGELEYGVCKYTQRILPEGIKLDLFIAEEGNFGLIYALRTGSADYSHKILATAWCGRGYHSKDGYLHVGHKKYECREEIDLFNRLSIPYVEPEFRNL